MARRDYYEVLGVSRTERVHIEKDRVQHRLPFLVVRKRLCASLALHKELNATPHAMRLNDAYYGTDRVQVVRRRVVDVLPLCYREESAVAIQCLLYGLDRSGSPRRDGHRDPRVDDGIAKREDGKREAIRHRILFLFSLSVANDVGDKFVIRQNKCSGTFRFGTSL